MTTTVSKQLITKQDTAFGYGKVNQRRNGVDLELDKFDGDDLPVKGLNSTIPRTLSERFADIVSIKDFGAVGDGVTDDTAAIQLAINSGAKLVTFPQGVFIVSQQVTLVSDQTLLGTGGTLKSVTGVGGYAILGANAIIKNLTIDGLKFDGEATYPVTTISRIGVPNATSAISIDVPDPDAGENITVRNCEFFKISEHGVRIVGVIENGQPRLDNISIIDNKFKFGAYGGYVILMNGAKNSTIQGNILDTNGPQFWLDASDSAYCNSASGIGMDTCEHVTVIGNTIRNTSESGMRIEGCTFITVTGNSLYDLGASGIDFYRMTYNCVCSGNIIERWGKIPRAGSIREYNGVYYVARESHTTSDPLPADPSITPWFEVWPYSLDNVDTGTIPAYDMNTERLLPFRGYGAITITTRSGQCTVTGNHSIGDITVDGAGKYNCASDFGFTYVHPINGTVTAPGFSSGEGNTLSGNRWGSTRLYEIYHPKFKDPILENGVVGTSLYTDVSRGTSLIEKQDKAQQQVLALEMGAGVSSMIGDPYPLVHSGVRKQRSSAANLDQCTLEITSYKYSNFAGLTDIVYIDVPAVSCLLFLEITYFGSRANSSDQGVSRVGKKYISLARVGSGFDVVIDNIIGVQSWEESTATAGGTINSGSTALQANRIGTEANTETQTVAIQGITRSGSTTGGIVMNVKVITSCDHTDLLLR